MIVNSEEIRIILCGNVSELLNYENLIHELLTDQ